MKTKQILIIGVGRFGAAVATTAYELGHEVIVVDQAEDVIEGIMNDVTQAIIADATEEATLEKLGCSDFDIVVIAIGEDLESNILATVAAKSAGAKHVISKAKNVTAAKILSSVGADEVIQPERDMGIRLAKRLNMPHYLNSLDLGDDHEISEFVISEKWAKSLKELQLPTRYGVHVLSVKHDNGKESEYTVGPSADYVLHPGDRVMLMGHVSEIENLPKEM